MACPTVSIVVRRTSIRISQSENGFVDGRRIGEGPGDSAIARAREVVGDAGGISEVTAAKDSVLRIVEGNAESPSGGAGNERSGICVPRVAAVSGRDHACRSNAAGRKPGALASLGGDAGSARRKSGFAGQCRRYVVTNVLPGLAVCGAENGKASVDGVAHRDGVLVIPEGEAIVEGVRILIHEDGSPVRAAVRSLIDARVSAVSYGKQVSDLIADALDIAELQPFSTGDYAAVPMVAAVGGDAESSTGPASPNQVCIHRAEADQGCGCAAALRSERRAGLREGQSCE